MNRAVRDGCISKEALVGRTQYRREKHVEPQWRKHASFAETLSHVELMRALSIIQPHACLYSVVELADNGGDSRWHAKTSKGIPQECSVDRVICFGEVDKAQVQWGVVFPRQLLQSSYYEHHVNRPALGSEPTLFLRQNVSYFRNSTEINRHATRVKIRGSVVSLKIIIPHPPEDKIKKFSRSQ